MKIKHYIFSCILLVLFSCTKRKDLMLLVEVENKAIADQVDIEKFISLKVQSAFDLDPDAIYDMKREGSKVSFKIKSTGENKGIIEELGAVFNSGGRGIEFWETYENSEISKDISVLDDSLLAMTRSTNAEPTPAAGLRTLQEKVDSMNKGQVKSRERTIYSLMKPAVYLNGTTTSFLPGSIIGYVNPSDTARLNAYIKIGFRQLILPPSLVIKFKRSDTDPKTLEVYALKYSNFKKQPALFGDIIDDARIDMTDYGMESITFNMKKGFVESWARLTRKASPKGMERGKSIAIVVDGILLTCPTVNAEIPNGNCSISGNFTPQECRNIQRKLKSVYFPYRTTLLQCALAEEQ
ncbi:MAG: SecDF P1 head subdomain-containing protein [Bacteroidia bacterium]